MTLSASDFDATSLDASSVRFGTTGAEAAEVHRDQNDASRRHVEDVNQDGLPDMVFHFRLEDSGLDCETTEARLTGKTIDGQMVEGSDAVRMVGH